MLDHLPSCPRSETVDVPISKGNLFPDWVVVSYGGIVTRFEKSKSGYTWDELIDIAIKTEQSGETLYTMAAGNSRGEAKESFMAFARDKKKHAEMLSSIKFAYREEAVGVVFNEGLLGYLERGKDMAEKFGSIMVVIEFSINFEEEALRFFISLRDHAPPVARLVIGEVVDENKKHVQKIRTLALTTTAGLKTPMGI